MDANLHPRIPGFDPRARGARDSETPKRKYIRDAGQPKLRVVPLKRYLNSRQLVGSAS